MRNPDPAARILCEFGQSKFASTFHTSRFVRQEKCWTQILGHAFCRRACATATRMDISPEPFCVDMSIKHRALTLSIRSPSVWPRCLGNDFPEAVCYHRQTEKVCMHMSQLKTETNYSASPITRYFSERAPPHLLRTFLDGPTRPGNDGCKTCWLPIVEHDMERKPSLPK